MIGEYLREFTLEIYLVNSGLKQSSDLDSIMEKYSGLFDERSVADSLLNVRDVNSRNMARILFKGHMNYVARHIVRELHNVELRTQATVLGRRIPFRSIIPMIMSENDRGVRNRLYEARLEALRNNINPLLEELWNRRARTVRRFGFSNYLHACSFVNGVDYSALRHLVMPILDSTDRTYYDKMDELLIIRGGISLQDANRADVMWALSGAGLAPGKMDVVALLERIAGSMGLSLRGITVDHEHREGKTPRAFVAPVDPPDDVRLVVRPHGGLGDVTSALHELGHALHYAHMDRGLPPQSRWVGDRGLTEAFAFLFEHVALEPLFAETVLKVRDLDEYLYVAYLAYLHLVRRYTAKLLYEVRAHKGIPIGALGRLYRSTLESALYYSIAEEEALADVDECLYTGDYLRAWIFEAMMRSFLRRRFGDDWFLNREAGKFLVDIWRRGFSIDLDAALREMGFKSLDVTPLIEQFSILARL